MSTDQTDIVSIDEAISELRKLFEAIRDGLDAIEKLNTLVPVQIASVLWLIDEATKALMTLRARIREGIEDNGDA